MEGPDDQPEVSQGQDREPGQGGGKSEKKRMLNTMAAQSTMVRVQSPGGHGGEIAP